MLTPAYQYLFQPTKPRLSIWSTSSAKARVNWTSGRRECVPCPRGLDSLGFSRLISLCEIWGFGQEQLSVKWMDTWHDMVKMMVKMILQRKVSQFTWKNDDKLMAANLVYNEISLNFCFNILRPCFRGDVFCTDLRRLGHQPLGQPYCHRGR